MKRNLIVVIAAGLAFGALAARAEPTLNFDEGYWKQRDIVVQAESSGEARAARQNDSDYLYSVNP
jgi:hypothetical protein